MALPRAPTLPANELLATAVAQRLASSLENPRALQDYLETYSCCGISCALNYVRLCFSAPPASPQPQHPHPPHPQQQSRHGRPTPPPPRLLPPAVAPETVLTRLAWEQEQAQELEQNTAGAALLSAGAVTEAAALAHRVTTAADAGAAVATGLCLRDFAACSSREQVERHFAQLGLQRQRWVCGVKPVLLGLTLSPELAALRYRYLVVLGLGTALACMAALRLHPPPPPTVVAGKFTVNVAGLNGASRQAIQTIPAPQPVLTPTPFLGGMLPYLAGGMLALTGAAALVKGVLDRRRASEAGAGKPAESADAALATASAAAAELKQMSSKESQRKSELLEAMVGALRERLKREEDRNTVLAVEVQEGRVELARAEVERRELLARVDDLRAELADTQEQLAALQAAADEDRLALARLQGKLAEREAQLQSASETEAELQQAVEAAKAAAQEMAAVLRHRDADVQLLREQLQTAGTSEELAALRKQLSELQKQRDGLQAARHAELTALRDRVRAAEEDNSRDLKQLKEKLAEAEAERDAQVANLRAALEETARQAAALSDASREEGRAEAEEELEELRGQLQEAKLKAEQASARRVAEVSELRSSLEVSLREARGEALAAREALAAVKQQLDGLLSEEWVEALEEELRQSVQPGYTPVAKPLPLSPELTEAMKSLEARESRLQEQLESLQRELAELQSAAVARLGPALVARAQELEGAAAKCRQVMRAREAVKDEPGMTRVVQQLAALTSELGSLYRTVMTPEQRSRERAVRAELQDRETEMRGVVEQRIKLEQQRELEEADAEEKRKKAKAAAHGPGQDALRQLVQGRVRQLLREREAQMQQQARAREAQLQLDAVMVNSSDAQRRELKVSQEAVAAQVRHLETSWKAQLEASNRALQEAAADKNRLAAEATLSTTQVRQQLSELDSLRSELSAAQSAVAALRRAAESSKQAAAQQSAGAASEVSQLKAQVARLEQALQPQQQQPTSRGVTSAAAWGQKPPAPPEATAPTGATPPIASTSATSASVAGGAGFSGQADGDGGDVRTIWSKILTSPKDRAGARGVDITRPGTAAAKVPLPAAAGPTTTTPGPLAVVPSAAAAASRRLQLSVSGYVLPQLGKENGSEDAWFSVTPLGGTATNGVVSAGAQPAGTVSALGVADGVGGWAQANVDPGQYSREMMAAVARAVEGKTSVSDPRDLLAAAQSAVRTVGSSTACFAVLDGSRALLSIANLGDSGCRVVRRGALVLATSPQEHTFNMPYQLAHPDNLPDTDTAEDAQVCGPGLTGLHVVCRAGVILADNSGGRPHVPQYLRCARHGASAPTPVRAVLTSAPLVYDGTVRTVQVYQLALEPGDVIIMGTDGLYDNMWDEQIVALATGAVTALGPALGVTAGMAAAATAQPAAQQLAATLANTAFRHAQDPSFRSPWAVELANQPDATWLQRLFPRGGKMDDITVVVAVVTLATVYQE
eukprot:XP_001700260.1 predicted protein [Chlamydomonas reinhardtii]